MKKEDEEYEIKWWKDWLEADSLKREEMVENLPVIREIGKIDKVPEDIRKHSFALMLICNIHAECEKKYHVQKALYLNFFYIPQ